MKLGKPGHRGYPILEVGEPDFDTPQCIKDECCKAIDQGHTHYTHSLGIPELREAICDHYYEKYNVTVDPDQVVVGSGTSPVMFSLLRFFLMKAMKS